MAKESLPLFPIERPASGKKYLTPVQAAYLAGIIDGEGYIGMQYKAFLSGRPGQRHRYKQYEYFVVLNMTDKVFMEGIAQMVPWGGGTVGRAQRTLIGRKKHSWRMKWSSNAAIEVCRAIAPYVRIKKPHVELVLQIADAKARAQGERKGPGLPYPQWIHELYMYAHKQFRILNQRGQDND